MQSTTPVPATHQVTTCPQCDNIVSINAEFCNICGKRLRPPLNVVNGAVPAASSAYPAAAQQEADDDEEDEDDDEYHGEEDEAPTTTALRVKHAEQPGSLPPGAGSRGNARPLFDSRRL